MLPDKAPSVDKELLGKLLGRLRPHIGLLIGAGVCLVLGSAISLAFPLVVRFLVDSAFVAENTAQLNQFAIILLVLFAFKGVLSFAQVYLLGIIGEKIVARLRTELFGHLLEKPLHFFSDTSSGELTSRLASDCSRIQSVLSNQLSSLVSNIINLVGALALLAYLHAQLMLTTLVVVPAVLGAAIYFGRKLMQRSTEVQDALADAHARAEEALTQMSVVKGFVAETLEGRLYQEGIQQVLGSAIPRAKIRGVFFGTVTFVSFAAIAVILWQGGRLIVAGAITPGDLVSFLLYAVTVAGSFTGLAGLWGSLQEALGSARRVFDLLDKPQPLPAPESPRPLPERVGPVEFQDVTFRYQPDDPPALKDVNLHIAAGETVALVGPSGAGKSTLVNLALRFWDPQQGTVLYHGIDLRDLDARELRSRVGLVPQQPLLFEGTIEDNIAYGQPDASPGAVHQAARQAHAHTFIEKFSKGYKARVGEGGVKVSGGQRQRIAIARVFLKDPEILILDEATSNLDSHSEQLVEEAFQQLGQGRTTIIIAHRLATVQRADRVFVLESGRVVEQGTHRELLDQGGLYQALYRGQLLEARPPSSAQQAGGEATI